MEKLQKIEPRKLVPIAAMVSAGKTRFLNVLYNINCLESREGIATKFVNILRYNPNITKPCFYHLKLVKEENDYTFYKDQTEEIIGEENILEENKKINNELSAKLQTDYEEIFYMTEINDVPFIKDKKYLLTHDLCDIPGLSEYQANNIKEDDLNEKNIEKKDNNLDTIMKEGEEKFGLSFTLDLFEKEEEEQNNNIAINNENKEANKDNNEDDIFYEVDIEKETSYLTKIFHIIKNYIDGAIIVLSIDKFHFRENYELIVKLHKVIQKDINNFLIILNKIDLSEDPKNDIEKCKAFFIKNFPKGKTFNINLNTFIAISTIQLQNELLMSNDFKHLMNYHFFNYVSKVKSNKSKGNPFELSFIDQLKTILEINGIKNKEIENKVEELNKSENKEEINNEMKLIIKELKQNNADIINMGITEDDFNDEQEEGNLLDDDNSDDENLTDEINDKDIQLNPSYIIKILYIFHKEKKLIPTYSEETNKLLDYFKFKEIKKEEEKAIVTTSLEEQTKKNRQVMNSLEVLSKVFINNKIDINEINDLVKELSKKNRYLKTYDALYIPFLGPSNAGKTTLINGIIGNDILPSAMNECTKRGIIINYWNRDDIIIGKTNFKEENINGHSFYSFERNNIIGRGLEQVKETLNGLNYEFTDKSEDFFYYITTRIKLFDDLELDDNYKKMTYLIDFPGYGTNNIYEKEIYNKAMSICNCFVFVVRNSLIKEKTNQKFLNSIFTQAKEQKKKSSSQFANSCLFIFNNDNLKETTEKDIEKAKKDIKEIIDGVDEDNIRVCFFNAKYYLNFCSINNNYFNLKFLFEKEMKEYLNYKNKIFTQPEVFKTSKTYKSFSDFFKKALTKKIQSEFETKKIPKDQKKDESVENEINALYKHYHLTGDKEKENDKDICIKIISYARDKIKNLKFYKESNLRDLENLFTLQINVIFFNMKEEFKEMNKDIISTLDLFFRRDITDRKKDLKTVQNLRGQIKEIIKKLKCEKKNGKKKIYNIIENYKKYVYESLKKKENNFLIQLKSKKYKEILKEVNEEIKNKLQMLSAKISDLIDTIDISALKLYSESITIITQISESKIDFPKEIRFGDFFSKLFGNKKKNLEEEILLELKISSKGISNIFEKKGIFEWFSSIFSHYKYLVNIYDIIVNTFIKKIEYIIKAMNEQYENYINHLIDIIMVRSNSITIEFTEEQKKKWESVFDVYRDIRSIIISINEKLSDKIIKNNCNINV